MATRLDAIVEFTLPYPYGTALLHTQELCGLYRCRILSSSTSRSTVIVAVPWPTFKSMFGRNPTVAAMSVPPRMSQFVVGMRVTGTQVIELYNAKKPS